MTRGGPLKKKRNVKRKHICTTCNKDFTRKSNLQTHMKTHDNLRVTYPCSMCCSIFTRVQDKVRHEKSIHKIVTFKHKCKACGKRFSRKDHAVKHDKSHLRGKIIEKMKTNPSTGHIIPSDATLCVDNFFCSDENLLCASADSLESYLSIVLGGETSLSEFI